MSNYTRSAERLEIRHRCEAAQGETLKWSELKKLHNFMDAPEGGALDHDDRGGTRFCGVLSMTRRIRRYRE